MGTLLSFFPQLGTGKWGWGREFFLAGKREWRRGKILPRPRRHPHSGIESCPRPRPRWGWGFFPNTGWGPSGDGDSSPHCHP